MNSRKIIAGLFAFSCGMLTFIITYYLLGFFITPLLEYIKSKLFK